MQNLISNLLLVNQIIRKLILQVILQYSVLAGNMNNRINKRKKVVKERRVQMMMKEYNQVILMKMLIFGSIPIPFSLEVL